MSYLMPRKGDASLVKVLEAVAEKTTKIAYRQLAQGIEFLISLEDGSYAEFIAYSTDKKILSVESFSDEEITYHFFSARIGGVLNNIDCIYNKTNLNLAFALAQKCYREFNLTTIGRIDNASLRCSENYAQLKARTMINKVVNSAQKSPPHPKSERAFESLAKEIKEDKEFEALFNQTFEVTCPELIAIFKPHLRKNSNHGELINSIGLIWNLIKEENNSNILFNLKNISCYLDSLAENSQLSMEDCQRALNRINLDEDWNY